MAAPAPQGRRLELMSLPAEVREVIYQHLFSYAKPLYTARSGKLIINKEARRDMQCLRTCVTFYCEAMPQIYALNTLDIDYDQIPALAWVPRHAEILVGKVIIRCYRPIDDHEGESGGLDVEEIDFGLLGQACPNVNSIEIHTFSSGSLLWVTQKLLRSLPCSSIREWPLLRLDIDVADDDNPRFNNANFATTGGKKILHGMNVSSSGTSWLDARSSFRLGHEVPRHLRSIVVLGSLGAKLCRMIETHTCAFGDCSFQKEKLARSKSIKSSTAAEASSTSTPSPKRIRYTWHKTGESIPPDEEQEAKVMAAMNQWVPRLDPAEYETMANCGYHISPDKLRPVATAAAATTTTMARAPGTSDA